MTLTIGRASLTDSEVVDYSFNGDVLTITGQIVPTAGASNTNNQARFDAVTQQLLGLQNNQDETVFPITWTVDPKLVDGFYTGFQVSVDPVPGVASVPVYATWSVTATRISNYASAELLSDVLAAVRTNGHSITSVVGVIWTGPDATGVYASPTSTTSYVRALSTVVATATVASATSTTFAVSSAPDDYYNTACAIEWKAADGNWYPVVGSQMPATTDWRITNGLVRLGRTSLTSSVAVEFEVFTGSWGNVVTEISGTQYASGAVQSAALGQANVSGVPPIILRNDPDVCSVRVPRAGVYSGKYSQTFTITRGQHFVTVTFTNINASKFGLKFNAVTACTALATAGAGLRATSDNADGDRLILMCTQPVTNDTTNGNFYQTAAATSITCGIGVEVDGSAAATPNTSAQVLDQFLCAVDTKTSVVKA